jgi:phage terminase large subunit GpA-like protein
MEFNPDTIGAGWLLAQTRAWTETLNRVKPSEYNERHRYLPGSVTTMPGPLSFKVNPYMREVVDCFDVDSPVREVNLKKGVQITYTTMLESGLFYYITHIKTVPLMYMTADKELADARVENNIIPMLNQSGFADVIRSSDVTNKRKTGKTKHHLQWGIEGYMVPFGAQNAHKMRQYSIAILLKDEIDAWPEVVGKDGDPDALSDDRCSGYWDRRKIFRGSTPLIKGVSKIEKAFKRGDQRRYYVRCLACGFPQVLRWEGVNKESGLVYGMHWDYTDEGALDVASVRYVCADCGHAHQEFDKTRLFSADHGAEWRPTATPADPTIRSYHLPAMYSPLGMAPWSKLVGLYLEAFDPVEKRVKEMGKLQVFYNNVLAEPFEVRGSRITFQAVSAHRRAVYRLGEVPNDHARQYAGSRVLFLTCAVDVHKENIAVAVVGWTKEACCYLIDYKRLHDEDCTRPESPVWGQLREIVEEQRWTSADGIEYQILMTFIDSGFANDTVCGFCADYTFGVYPTLGRDRTARQQSIKEFAEFKTQAGTVGYRILVDYYKDRIATALRREWSEEAGPQKVHHFNAPVDTTDAQLKELTRETKVEKVDEMGRTSWVWKQKPRNELWDLLVYNHAALEVFAWLVCVGHYELDGYDWDKFWGHFDLR